MNRCLAFKKHTSAFSFSSPPASAAVTGITDVRVTFFANESHATCFDHRLPPQGLSISASLGVHAAAAACGRMIEKGRWCSKARSRWPTIVYFGLWVGGIMPATPLRK
jgi:hypothetical protein